jgi:hypothetical protein
MTAPTIVVQPCADPLDVEALPAFSSVEDLALGALARMADGTVVRRVGRDDPEVSTVTNRLPGTWEIVGDGLPVPGVDGATRSERWGGYLTQVEALKEAMQIADRFGATVEVQS